MAEANNLHSKPWWVQFFLQVGFPTAMAILLLATLLGWMPSPLMRQIEEIAFAQRQSAYVLRVMCYVIATTAKEKSWCEQQWEPPRKQ